MKSQIILVTILVFLVGYTLSLNHNVNVNASSIVVMNDSSATTGQYINSTRQIMVEFAANTNSVLIGKYIDSMTMQLKIVGTPTGTATFGLFNKDLSVKKTFGTKDVSTIGTSYANYNFALPSNAPYKIQLGDRIGMKYTVVSGNSYPAVQRDTNALFDGTNSIMADYTTGWNNRTSWDLYMVLTVTQPTLTATAVSATQINLSWSAPLNATSFQIERESPVGGGFSVIVSNTGNTATTYSDTGLAPNTQYNYRVTMRDSGGVTNIVSTTSAATTPQIPSVTEYFTSFFQIIDSSVSKIRFYIDSSGNIGIGTKTPAAKLDVNSTINVGNLTSTAVKEFKITAPSGVPICIGTGC